MKKVLTIAGSDCSGGAGIQADLKTMAALGTYGMSAIAALTAQNTTGVFGILEVEPNFLALQLDAIFQDIFPDAVKIGMVANPDLVKVIAQKLQEWKASNIVVDPVMVATSSGRLMKTEAIDVLIEKLFPLAQVITPNLEETEILAKMKIASEDDMLVAARKIASAGSFAVLVKGGHQVNESAKAKDLLYCPQTDEVIWYNGERFANPNTHGTGCTLSSAIAVYLAKGHSLAESVGLAKQYVAGAIAQNFNLGQGRGPINHLYLQEK